jgi:cytochrome P450
VRAESVILPVLRQVNSRPRLAPVLDRVLAPYNPFSPTMNVDPYPAYAALRERGPVFRHRRMGMWVVTSYELCEEILRSPVGSVDRGDLFDQVSPWSKLRADRRSMFTKSILLVDPPDHTRLRKLMSRAFTPRTVEQIAPRITEIAAELVGKAAEQDRVDLFSAVFAPLPIYVIGELLGIPEDDWPRLKAWSDEFAKVIDPVDAFDPAVMTRAIDEFTEALDGWIDHRTAEPGPDLLSQLIAAEEDGGRLTREELRSMISILMTAGHETTSGLLGNAVVALDDRADVRTRMAEEPDVAARAVEELLRFDSPVQNTDRIPLEPLEVGGHRIPAGQMVMLSIGAANRDPDRFDEPDRIDIDRTDLRPLSFGHGIHHCLGAALARKEAAIVLPMVFRELPHHRVVPAEVEWKRSMTLRGPIRLPVHKA